MSSIDEQRSTWGWMWLLCLLVILGSHARWVGDDARIVPGAVPSLMSPASAWVVPLARLPAAEAWTIWPYGLFAAAAAAVITAVCHGPDRSTRLDRLLAATGLGLLISPADLCCAVALGLLPVSRLTQKSTEPVADASFVVAGGVGLAVLGTLEFGLVLFVSLAVLTSIGIDPRKVDNPGWRNVRPLALFLVAVLLAWSLIPGFGAAALRPVNWLWLRPPRELMPTLSPTWNSWSQLAALGLLAPLMIRGGQSILKGRCDFTKLAVCSFALSLACACQRFASLGGLTTVLLFRQLPAGGLRLPRMQRVWAAGLLVAGGCAAWVSDAALFSAGTPIAQRIDPLRWDAAGPVILLNLDQTRDWQTADRTHRYPLLVDDRWDALGAEYVEYAALCRDLREVRDHAYLRTDGRWGGYLRLVNDVSPSLVIVESIDVEAIRGLSLSPNWRLMGIDGAQTYFGRVGEPRHVPQMQQALRCLMTLEWPARLTDFTLENTIVAGNRTDDRTVAGALNALRFPYAALRFIRTDHGAAAGRLRASCYLELAHRVAAHSSSGSLLDQCRAIIRAGKVIDSLPLGSVERQRLVRGMRTLIDDRDGQPMPAAASAEERVRSALLEGRVATLQKDLDGLSEPLAAFYQVLAEAADREPAEIYSQLAAVIARFDGQVSVDVRSEAAFYLGCAAIEAGESLAAVAAFEISQNLSPDHPFREIRAVYLNSLTR